MTRTYIDYKNKVKNTMTRIYIAARNKANDFLTDKGRFPPLEVVGIALAALILVLYSWARTNREVWDN